jgi:hypothetical protein
MTDSITIPKSRFDQALRHLIEVQMKPLNYSQHKQQAWQALDALAPELRLIEPSEAWERLKIQEVEG